MKQEDLMTEILNCSVPTYYKKKREGNPGVLLIEKYFTKNKLKEFLETGKVEKFEKGLVVDEFVNKVIDRLFNKYNSPNFKKILDFYLQKFCENYAYYDEDGILKEDALICKYNNTHFDVQTVQLLISFIIYSNLETEVFNETMRQNLSDDDMEHKARLIYLISNNISNEELELILTSKYNLKIINQQF